MFQFSHTFTEHYNCSKLQRILFCPTFFLIKLPHSQSRIENLVLLDRDAKIVLKLTIQTTIFYGETKHLKTQNGAMVF